MTGRANASQREMPPVDARRRRSASLSPSITIATTHTSTLIVTRPMISIVECLTLLQPVIRDSPHRVYAARRLTTDTCLFMSAGPPAVFVGVRSDSFALE
jgi:hypothetical protein